MKQINQKRRKTERKSFPFLKKLEQREREVGVGR